MIISETYSSVELCVLNEQFKPMNLAEATDRFDFQPRRGRDPYSTAWNNYCRENRLYFYPTDDYVSLLAEYLKVRCRKVENQESRSARILEAGAGKGRLSFLLDQKLSYLGVDAQILPADDMSWGTDSSERVTISDQVDVRDAVNVLKPDFVIAAWPPVDQCRLWCQSFMEEPRVDEYLFIGIPGQSMGTGLKNTIPESIAGDFEVRSLDYMTPTSLCYFSTSFDMHPSVTISFQRPQLKD